MRGYLNRLRHFPDRQGQIDAESRRDRDVDAARLPDRLETGMFA